MDRRPQKTIFWRIVLPSGIGLLLITTLLLLPAAIAPSSSPITATLAAYAPYDPATYGIPYEIASYKILAVMTSDNMACIPSGMMRSIIQSSHPGVRDLLANDSDTRVVAEALKQLPAFADVQWTLEVVSSAPWNAARFISSVQRWNDTMKNGCVKLGPHPPIILTPTVTP
jgi:hypothetical protein